MKKLAFISAVVFTTLTIQSCRQADEVLSPEEAATLQRVQDSSATSLQMDNANSVNTNQNNNTASFVDGEILPPPKK
ncbi:hypothetical protein [Kaistella antarctica]|uniref:Uncharacterized protein n=1 Tax=Kaistella antarctica TaxID=266748 RepID=A0A3S4VC17_9FLAO|nr:hypothetical protein [Kaistella antarctica]KEY19827.1 hypothetical protein HY04_00945 [Kaistella antarctica]SEV97189.1 hypothetical protein SAMN05421765_1586 [Kaistella antarctica]VEH96387.1 Uncharacterised protein [Kaistella antarctica]